MDHLVVVGKGQMKASLPANSKAAEKAHLMAPWTGH
jgi:hypothetical protein